VRQVVRPSQGGSAEGIRLTNAYGKTPLDIGTATTAPAGAYWLHPNDAGYKVMGEAVDLALFR